MRCEEISLNSATYHKTGDPEERGGCLIFSQMAILGLREEMICGNLCPWASVSY